MKKKLQLILAFINKTFFMFAIPAGNTKPFFKLLKLINRLSGNRFKSIFVCYIPKEKDFLRNCFSFVFYKTKWKLIPLGFHRQYSGWGFNFGMNVIEVELTHPNNKERLSEFIIMMENLRQDLGIEYINYSGILPSILKKYDLPTSASGTREVVSKVVSSCLINVLKKESYHSNRDNLIVLGGNGYIGSSVRKVLDSQKLKYTCIDINNSSHFEEIFKQSKRKFILDISGPGEIYSYNHLLTEVDVIINEVYPPPKLEKLNTNHLYHIRGIKATVFPNLPHKDYHNALPCCSIVPHENLEDNINKIVVWEKKQLSVKR